MRIYRASQNGFAFPDYVKYSQYYRGYFAPGIHASFALRDLQPGPTGLNRRSMNVIENFFAAIILNWKIDHRIRCRPVPLAPVNAGGGYFRPADSRPDPRPVARRSCGYSSTSSTGAFST
jgi:hypothetical protein